MCVVWIWFGPPPPHLPLLLQSVGSNPEIDVLLFTDWREWSGLPANVKMFKTTLSELTLRVQGSLDFAFKIMFPYKCCDLRPMYGEIFSRELASYSFWGWGDLDVIWGKLSHSWDANILESSQKIFQFGALSFLRNSPEVNSLFRKEGGLDWKDVLQSGPFRGFDETLGIFQKIERLGFKRHYPSDRVDIVPIRPWFSERQHRNRRLLYSWVNGETYREWWTTSGLVQERVSYIHFQKRRLNMLSPLEKMKDRFWITPSGFMHRPERPTRKEFHHATHLSTSLYIKFACFWGSRLIKRARSPFKVKDVR